MSSKIAKKMMANVDEMVARASTAITRADQPRSKRKAAKRALTGSISKRGAQGLTSGAASAKSGSVSKRRGRRKVGLLEQARRELRGASRAEMNIRLLSYSRKPGKAGTKKVKSKTQKAVERLLDVDVKEGAKSRKG